MEYLLARNLRQDRPGLRSLSGLSPTNSQADDIEQRGILHWGAEDLQSS